MDEIELFDIYDIWYEPSWFIRYWKIIALLGISMVCIAIALWFYKKKMTHKKTCWEHALERLAQLKTVHKSSLFYCDLTTILKEYLMNRYQLDLVSKTDWEIVQYLDCEEKLPPSIIHDLKKIFGTTTEMKFAHQKIGVNALQDDLLISVKIVQNSIPKTVK